MKFFKKNKVADFIEAYHPLLSIATLAAVYAAPYADRHDLFKSFSDLSYATTVEKEGVQLEHHKKGWDDALFVFFWFNVVTVVRYFYINILLRPIAKYYGMSKGLTRKFVDCGWFSMFYLVATGIGIYIFRDDAWWYSSHDLWKGYPHAFDYATKYYYLASLAFWLQCLFSFFFEAPRKDDGAFFFHHLLTIGLIVSSYHFNFFRVGAAILLEQNAADVFYYHAKAFKYAGWERLSSTTVIIFLFVWVYTRHYIFGWILYSVWYELPLHLQTPGWDHATGYYYTDTLKYAFMIALGALQGLMIYWFAMILRVVYRVAVANETNDPTDASSSDEEEEKEEKVEKNGADKPHEKLNGVNGKHKGTNGKAAVKNEPKKVK